MEFLNDQAYDILQKDTAGREVRSAADQFVDGSAHMEVGQGDVAHAVRVPVVGDHGYPVGRLQAVDIAHRLGVPTSSHTGLADQITNPHVEPERLGAGERS